MKSQGVTATLYTNCKCIASSLRQETVAANTFNKWGLAQKKIRRAIDKIKDRFQESLLCVYYLITFHPRRSDGRELVRVTSSFLLSPLKLALRGDGLATARITRRRHMSSNCNLISLISRFCRCTAYLQSCISGCQYALW